VNTVRSLEKTLEAVPEGFQIGIEGHTDDTPIQTRQVADNWDLSSKRAMAVMHALALSPKLLKRTVLMAYGEMRPLVPNRSPAGLPLADNQSRNRRVTIRIF
jgi:chemotaxis protein MotB